MLLHYSPVDLETVLWLTQNAPGTRGLCWFMPVQELPVPPSFGAFAIFIFLLNWKEDAGGQSLPLETFLSYKPETDNDS